MAVVRASNGALLATLTGNGLGHQRPSTEGVLITDLSENPVSLFRAVDFSPQFFPTGRNGSEGRLQRRLNFWIVFTNTNRLARF
jgi:hypothetical protein